DFVSATTLILNFDLLGVLVRCCAAIYRLARVRNLPR
ncbi:MAG: hypothetical protein ACI9TZ_000845, partial [Yoonia sp.]